MIAFLVALSVEKDYEPVRSQYVKVRAPSAAQAAVRCLRDCVSRPVPEGTMFASVVLDGAEFKETERGRVPVNCALHRIELHVKGNSQ